MSYPYSSRNKQIAILVAVSALALLVAVVALNTVVLQNVGNVKTVDVKVYWDSNRTNEVSSINWGAVEPGATKNVSVYVLNAGNSDATLSMHVTNWSSSNASNYITPSWNYNGQIVSPGQVLRTTFTLAVSPNIQGVTSFSFDIVVSISG